MKDNSLWIGSLADEEVFCRVIIILIVSESTGIALPLLVEKSTPCTTRSLLLFSIKPKRIYMLLLSSVLAFIENTTSYQLHGTNQRYKHVIAFDLDKTIGDFDIISGMHGLCYSENVNVLELFPECFRPANHKSKNEL